MEGVVSGKPSTASELREKAEEAAARMDQIIVPFDPPTVTYRKVTQALAAVMADLPAIGKDGRADPKQGGYAYRGIEQITKHAQGLFAKHGVVMVPQVESCEVRDITVAGKPWTDTTLHVTYEVHGPAGDSVKVRTVGIGRDNSDKGANKAMTQAFKYALLQLLCISDAKDDVDGQTHEADAPRPVWQVGHAKQRLFAAVGGDKDLAAQAWQELRGDDRWREWEHAFPTVEVEEWLNQPAQAEVVPGGDPSITHEREGVAGVATPGATEEQEGEQE